MKTNLYYIRTEQGLSLRALAKRVGVTAQTLCSIEAETTAPSLRLLVELAKELNVTPNDLIWIGIHDQAVEVPNVEKKDIEGTICCPNCMEEVVKVFDIGRVKIKCGKCSSSLFCDLEQHKAYKVD